MLTRRDKQVLQLIEKFRCISMKQIHNAIYSTVSEKRSRERMKLLSDRKIVKRYRGYIDQSYIYYLGAKPRQIEHKLKLVDLYIALNKPEVFDVEYTCANIRADAYTEIKKRNKLYSFFVEVQHTAVPNYKKYVKLYDSRKYKKYFYTFPRVLIITNHHGKIPVSEINFIILNENLKNLEKIYN